MYHEHGLEPNLENLQVLALETREEEEMPRPQFKAPCNTPLLQKLDLDVFPDGIIDGEELLRLARYCPKIKYINIGATEMFAKCCGISDLVIGTISDLLPDLVEFELRAKGSSLTGQALVYFGRNCKALCCLVISWYS